MAFLTENENVSSKKVFYSEKIEIKCDDIAL